MNKRHVMSSVLIIMVCLGLLGLSSLGSSDKNIIQDRKFPITKKPVLMPLPDLTVSIVSSPAAATVGQTLQSIDVLVKNVGQATKKAGPCFNVFLVLSSDTHIPLARPKIGGPFKEDRALGAGMGTCVTLKPGDSYHIHNFGVPSQNIPMAIPSDTPPGKYYLGVVVDGEKWILESSEQNNTHFAAIKIISKKIKKPTAVASKTVSGTQKPIPIILPDIKPTNLYFDALCNLKAKIQNIGKKKIDKNVHFKLYMNDKMIGSSGCSLDLVPGAETSILVSSRALLGVWVKETKKWKLEMDSNNEVFEEKENNNSITVYSKCSPPPKQVRKKK